MDSKSKSTRHEAAPGWGARLAWLQSCSKLNQGEFADAIEIGRDMFSRWVNERIPKGPNASSLDGIVEFFRVPKRYWVTGFVLKNECRAELEDFIGRWEPEATANLIANSKPSSEFVQAIADIADQLARACLHEQDRVRGSPREPVPHE